MRTLLIIMSLVLFSCKEESKLITKAEVGKNTKNRAVSFEGSSKTIHVFVALCDNKYQGIVPVPAKIGNGQDPDNNLYWGCAYGIRLYFKKSKEWKFLKSEKNINDIVLERVIFKHTSKDYYLVADACDGKYIKECTVDFLKSSSGIAKDTLLINNETIGISDNSSLVSYIGHDGLMDFQLSESFKNTDNKKRDVIILACYSKRFFFPHLADANVNPLVWSTNLMAPEAYVIHDAITGYVNNEDNQQIRNRAARAYSKFQKCSEKAAKNLLVTNW